MPAGTYTVRREIGSNIIRVRNVQTGTSALAMGRWEAPSKKTNKLIFRRYGSQYFLTAILGGQGSQGMVFSTSRQEKEVQEAQTQANSTNTVEVASR
jgi:hypothetical protein